VLSQYLPGFSSAFPKFTIALIFATTPKRIGLSPLILGVTNEKGRIAIGLGIQFHSYSALIELLPDDCGTVGTGDARVPLARLGHVFG
jgi:hypothetical protein